VIICKKGDGKNWGGLGNSRPAARRAKTPKPPIRQIPSSKRLIASAAPTAERYGKRVTRSPNGRGKSGFLVRPLIDLHIISAKGKRRGSQKRRDRTRRHTEKEGEGGTEGGKKLVVRTTLTNIRLVCDFGGSMRLKERTFLKKEGGTGKYWRTDSDWQSCRSPTASLPRLHHRFLVEKKAGGGQEPGLRPPHFETLVAIEGERERGRPPFPGA